MNSKLISGSAVFAHANSAGFAAYANFQAAPRWFILWQAKFESNTIQSEADKRAARV
jgi:hypothetical protein